ncbi:citrate synthase [Tistlia consotensis]|uniref:citrate synthase (unknown stereospecificity) n=1 Tax=Tistlia consotensis USBA 355 TaxID=560819 RepID=A0A1Y6BQF8_9PROT|nr:citryl-CoA lyase [Tistlia consotensis]SMF21974.1 citrate synthase [Tistlia consotensis USBA 355]SNR46412.1 citrate synthase [Tistlia consotensis]
MTQGTGGNDVSDWWRTSIIDMEPGRIEIRGRPIQHLIGELSFPQMIWLLVMGEMIEGGRAKLLEAALVAAVDHGPQAPSIAIARMAVTCGVGLNNAMASAVNVLGDVHGGAGEQAVELYQAIDRRWQDGEPLAEAAAAELDAWRAANGKYVSGFGHRFHKPVDPRGPRLLGLVDLAVERGQVSGRFAAIARAIGARLAEERGGRPVPLNIDGSTAVIYAELGCPAPLARGLFCLSRSVGILAHAWEQKQQGGRNKGPTPPAYRWTYEG